MRFGLKDPLDDIAFAVFAIAWVPTRHFLMLSILVLIVEISPRVMSCGATIWEVVSGAVVERCPPTWDYTAGYYWNGEVMIPICAKLSFQHQQSAAKSMKVLQPSEFREVAAC